MILLKMRLQLKTLELLKNMRTSFTKEISAIKSINSGDKTSN